MTLEIPKALKGKYIEITISERNAEEASNLNNEDFPVMMGKEIEMQMLDKVRNQLSVWDM